MVVKYVRSALCFFFFFEIIWCCIVRDTLHVQLTKAMAYKNPNGRNNWNPSANYENPISDPSQTLDLSPPGTHQTSSDYLCPLQ